MKSTKDKIIEYALGFNIFIVILIAIVGLTSKNNFVFDTLQTIWLLSFGWLCGRMSRL